MKWDEVERELLITGVQLGRLGRSFQALAAALQLERNSGTRVVTRGVDAPDVADTQKKDGGLRGPRSV